jgi:hypothetical protein
MRARDGIAFENFTGTTANFTLGFGGLYGAEFSATFGGGTVQLNVLGPDGATWIPAAPAWTANGTAVIYLPSGTYQLVVVTATAVYVSISRIPGD